MIKSIYENSTSAVLLNAEGEFFKTSVGLRHICLLSPTLFKLFFEEIMS